LGWPGRYSIERIKLGDEKHHVSVAGVMMQDAAPEEGIAMT